MGIRRRILLVAMEALGSAAGCHAAARAPAAQPRVVGEPTSAAQPRVVGGPGSHQEEGLASYYAKRFSGRRTASGERYNPGALTAAHRTLPFGTRVRVTRTDGRSVVVRINDRGPHSPRLVIDLSEAAARRLNMMKAGLVRVRVEQVR